jgi:hypothetical protein
MRAGPVITEAVASKIASLVMTMQKPTAGKIANRLGLKESTVYWHLLSRNLINNRPQRYNRGTYVRNGHTINPYTRAHDERLTELRVAGKNFREIAAAMTAEFGIRRTAHSIVTRLVILANTDDEAA